MSDRQEKHRAYMREWARRRYAERTPEEIERHRAYMREYMNARNAAMTPEEREEFNAAKREYARQRRANETPEQREKRLAYARAYAEKRKAENPEAVKESMRRWSEKRRQHDATPEYRAARLATGKRFYDALRMTALVRYSGNPAHCVCCGERHLEFLAIDHVNGGGSEHRKVLKGTSILKWLRDQGYPDGFRVLCHNCNMATRFGKACPHELERIVPFERPQGGCS